MADDLDTVYCTYCGGAQSIVSVFDHMEACARAAQADRKAALAALPASHLALFDDHKPADVWGPVKSADTAVDARDATEILPGLFLGNVIAAKNAPWLHRHSVVGIVNCANEIEPLSGGALDASGVKEIVAIGMRDDEEVRYVPSSFDAIRRAADEIARLSGDAPAPTAEAVEAAMAVPPSQATLGPAPAAPVPDRRAVLVHCAVGRSRSASALLAYLVLHRGMSLVDAYLLVRARRPIVLPNVGFLAAVVVMEEARAGACTVPEPVLRLHPAALRGFDVGTGRALRRDTWAEAVGAARAHAASRK